MTSNDEGPRLVDGAHANPPPWWSSTSTGAPPPKHSHQKGTKQKVSKKGTPHPHKGHKGKASSGKTHVHRKATGYGVDADHKPGSNFDVLKGILHVPKTPYGHHKKSTGKGRHKSSHKLHVARMKRPRHKRATGPDGSVAPPKTRKSKSKGVAGGHSSALAHEKTGGIFRPAAATLIAVPAERLPDRASRIQSFSVPRQVDNVAKAGHHVHGADSSRP